MRDHFRLNMVNEEEAELLLTATNTPGIVYPFDYKAVPGQLK